MSTFDGWDRAWILAIIFSAASSLNPGFYVEEEGLVMGEMDILKDTGG